jgi:hypothetical protein
LRELQPLGAHLSQHDGHAGDIPPGPPELGDEPAPHGVGTGGHHDRDGLGRRHGRPNGHGDIRNEDVGLQADQLRGQGRQSIAPPQLIPPVDNEVLPLDVSEATNFLAKSLRRGLVERIEIHQDTNTRHLPRLLRLAGERHGEEHRPRASEEGAAVHHRIIFFESPTSLALCHRIIQAETFEPRSLHLRSRNRHVH